MYNLKNDYDRYYIDEHCLFNKPVEFYSQKLYCPMIAEIVNMGESEYGKLLSPILCDLSFYIGNDSINNKIDILEFIIFQHKKNIMNGSNSITLFSYLKKSLSYFLRTPIENIKECMNNSIIIYDKNNSMKNSMILDINKFRELRDIICEMTGSKIYTYLDIKKEDNDDKVYSSDSMLNERIKRFERAKKINNMEKEEKENKIIQLYNVMSFVSNHKGYDIVKNYNIYQLINSYEFINANTSFKFDLRIASSGFVDSNFKIRDVKEILAK